MSILMPKAAKEINPVDELLDAVETAMIARKVGNAELGRQTGLHQKLIWKWMNREVFPNGLASLKLLQWVTGVKLQKILSLRLTQADL